MNWLQWIAAVFLIFSGVISADRFRRSKNKGHLFIACCLLLAGGIFLYLAIKSL